MKFLVKKAKRHDNDAFVELMESQKLTMYKVARSYLKSDDDVADAIQETILTCYEKIDSLENEQFFKTWLIRILINKCIEYRTILILYYVEGFKIREIAQILDMDENTVKTRLSRGRKAAAREYRIEPVRYAGRAAAR